MDPSTPTALAAQRPHLAPLQSGMVELFPELHGLVARAALRGESDALEAWQRLRLVSKAWHDGLEGVARIASPVARSSG